MNDCVTGLALVERLMATREWTIRMAPGSEASEPKGRAIMGERRTLLFDIARQIFCRHMLCNHLTTNQGKKCFYV